MAESTVGHLCLGVIVPGACHSACRYGMVLQQCAHFYNNIATEMIPCQKPMMLAEAVEFEKVQP